MVRVSIPTLKFTDERAPVLNNHWQTSYLYSYYSGNFRRRVSCSSPARRRMASPGGTQPLYLQHHATSLGKDKATYSPNWFNSSSGCTAKLHFSLPASEVGPCHLVLSPFLKKCWAHPAESSETNSTYSNTTGWEVRDGHVEQSPATSASDDPH